MPGHHLLPEGQIRLGMGGWGAVPTPAVQPHQDTTMGCMFFLQAHAGWGTSTTTPVGLAQPLAELGAYV